MADRAGETSKLQQGPPSISRAGPIGHRGAGTGIRHTPSASTSSFALQTPSATGRVRPNGTASTSGGARSNAPPPALSRPASAMGHVNPPTDSSVPSVRPASVLGSSSTANGQSALGKRKGTTPFSISQHLHHSQFSASEGQYLGEDDESCFPYGIARSDSPHGVNPSSFARSLREVSLSSAMRNLRITSDPSPPREMDISRCSTPCLIPKPTPSRKITTPIPFTPSRVVKRTASPQKLPYLTRESRTKAWDTKGRLEDMELLYSELKEQMHGTMRERNGLEETVDQSRSRSTYPCRSFGAWLLVGIRHILRLIVF